MTWPHRLLLVVGLAVTAGVVPSMATAVQVVVVDHDGPTSGSVVLQPAVVHVAADAAPARFLIANEGTNGIVAAVTLSDPGRAGEESRHIADVSLAAGEAARVELGAADASGPVARLDVQLEGTDDRLVGWVVGRGPGQPVDVELDAGNVLLSSAEPTVVTVQIRRRSWLGISSFHLLVGPLALLEAESIERGRGPWLPGPAWTDVHVTDHAGTTTSATFREGSVARDAGLALILVAAASFLLWRQARRDRSAGKSSGD